MRVLFAPLLILCAIGVIAQQSQSTPASPSHRVKQQEPANGHDEKTGSHASPSNDPTGNSNTTFILQETPEQNNERGKQSSYWDKVISPDIFPIWIASLIAIVGAGIAIGTLIAIRDEATKIKEVANAATRNAEALMLGDRAWLLMKKTLTQDVIDDPVLLTVEEMAVRQQSSHCLFTLRNYGKTPGRMIGWRYELQIGNSPSIAPNPDIYEMSKLPIFTPDMVPQGASVAQQAEFKVPPSAQDFLDIASGIKFLWLCGTIWYEDIFGRGMASIHETVFCYRWETRMSTPKFFWTLAGPPEHNKAT
jgi:hypothetical protein